MTDAYLSKRIVSILRARCCAPLFSNCSLQHLPAELIVNILSELPAREIALWQTVSRQFRDVVANSVTLQYKIECCVADVLEEPLCLTRDKEEQLNAMREWSRAWKNADWKRELTEAGALAEGVDLDRPPLIIRGAMGKTYNFSDLEMYEAYGYDAEYNVIVVAERDVGIFLEPLDFVTRGAHLECSDYAQPMVVRGLPDSFKVDVFVQGHIVMCRTTFEDYPSALGMVTEYHCFDWRTGNSLLNIWSDGGHSTRMDDFAFLSERFHVITGHHRHKSFLAVFDLGHTSGVCNSVEEMLYSAIDILELPRASSLFLSPVLSVDCQPMRSTLPTTYQDALFTPANSSPVIHVHMAFAPLDEGRTRHFDLLIPWRILRDRYSRTARLAYHETCEKIIVTPVHEWCQAARLLEGPPTCKNAVCGSRYVTRETDPGSGKPFVAIYDFCPLEAVLRDLGRNEVVEFKFGSVPLQEHFPGCAGETAAPYRRTGTNIMLEDDEYPQLTEDSIVIVRGSGSEACRTRVYCF